MGNVRGSYVRATTPSMELQKARIGEAGDMASQTTETDAKQWEYTTYSPRGETCPACLKAIKPLERVRRGCLERQSGAPVVVYRHVECRKG